MMSETELHRDPAFRKLLAARARWRWGLSTLLIGAYLAWGVAGIYFQQAYAAPIPGTAIPAGMLAGIVIIVLSIILSIVYVRVVSRLEAVERHEVESGQ
jgi:uncharacterized membrane protein (DUF485 family)